MNLLVQLDGTQVTFLLKIKLRVSANVEVRRIVNVFSSSWDHMLETIGVRRPYESSSLKVHFKGDESRVLFKSESKKVSSCLDLDAGRSIEDVLVKDWRLLQTNRWKLYEFLILIVHYIILPSNKHIFIFKSYFGYFNSISSFTQYFSNNNAEWLYCTLRVIEVKWWTNICFLNKF